MKARNPSVKVTTVADTASGEMPVEATVKGTEGAEIIEFPTDRRLGHRLISLSELQKRFGYSERWWRYRLAEGMPRHKWGCRLRFDPDEVAGWLDERYGYGAQAG